MPNNRKLKLSHVIPSFQLCRSKDLLSLAHAPTRPAIYRLSPCNTKTLDINYPNLPAPPPTTPNDHSPAKFQLSSKIVFGARNLSLDWSSESMDFICNKEYGNECQAKPRPYVPSRLSSYYDDCGRVMSPVGACEKDKRRRNKKEKTSLLAFDHSSCFSSDAVHREETETLLVSSSRFNYDSSCEFSHSPDCGTDTSFMEATPRMIDEGSNDNVRKIRELGRQVSRRWIESSIPTKTKTKTKTTTASPEIRSPVMASFFKRITTCGVDEKVKESTAILKKSDDPYGDFKRSMLEMILEKQIFEAEGLEELLQCFLTLNSRQYHGVIVEAFSEIWHVLFCDSPVHQRASIKLKLPRDGDN